MAVTDYGKSSDISLAERCVVLRGWRRGDLRVLGVWDEVVHYTVWTDPSGQPKALPPYSSDLNAARELEDEIERRGKVAQEQYFSALWSLTVLDLDGSTGELWFRCVHATARQKAEALCAVMSAEKERE